MSKKILAFSSSRAGNGGFLEKAAPEIHSFLGKQPLNIAFIPFASVSKDHPAYGGMVCNALNELPYKIQLVQYENAKETIRNADAVMVGGGNTFKLLHDIYALKLLDLLRDKVDGGAPYIGWSAGSNITGPTICTTNDMPVIQPQSFNALGLLPFQINPHYYNLVVEGFNGETRDQRLTEFIQLNPGIPVLGLPEGTFLKMEDGKLSFWGEVAGVLFPSSDQQEPAAKKLISPGEDISFLL